MCGGTVPIDAERSRAAIMKRIAEPIGRPLIETAYGIHMVANANMMRAIKGVTTYRGRDPRDFSLYAFGGNGGVHGVELARSLQIPMVIVPPAAGVFSAIGLLTANVELTLAQALLSRTREMDLDRAEQVFGTLEDQIAQQLGFPRQSVTFTRAADLRYTGQAFELTVPAPNRKLDAAALEELERLFELEHERTYGHAFRGTYAMETVTLRVTGSVTPEGVQTSVRTNASHQPEEPPFGLLRPGAWRARYAGPRRAARSTARLRAGPLIVEEYEGTTVVPPNCAARLDDAGNIVIEVGRAAEEQSMSSNDVDPFLLEVLKNGLDTIADEMALVTDEDRLFGDRPQLDGLLDRRL